MPTKDDLASYEKRKEWVYTPLPKELEEKRIDFINLGQDLFDSPGRKDCKELYGDLHFSACGNAIFAGTVFNRLKERNLVPVSP